MTSAGEAISQEVRAVNGFAYGVVGADLHVFSDGSPLYFLARRRRPFAPSPDWLRADIGSSSARGTHRCRPAWPPGRGRAVRRRDEYPAPDSPRPPERGSHAGVRGRTGRLRAPSAASSTVVAGRPEALDDGEMGLTLALHMVALIAVDAHVRGRARRTTGQV
jgi:hypothetical protein